MAFDSRDMLVRVKGDTSDFERSMRGVKGSSTDAGLSFGKLTGAIAAGNIITGAAEKGFGLLVDGIKETIASAENSENVLAQLDAVLKSTGGAAGVTRDEVTKLATELQKSTTFTHEQVTSAESMLLTFTNIHKNVFPATTRAVVDMATAMHQDLQTTAIQVGKALQDPVQGVTALQRVGVRLSDSQKELVKQMMAVGNTAGAQQLILKELQTEFGGSAEAAGGTFAGSLERLKNQMNDVKESIGGVIIKGITPFTQQLANFVASDKFQTWVRNSVTFLSQLINSFVTITKAVEDFAAKTATRLRPQLEVLSNHLKSDLWPALQRLWKEALEPISRVALPVLVEAIKLTIVIMTDLVEAVSSVINRFLDTIKMLESLPDRVKKAWVDIDQFFKAKWANVTTSFDDAKKHIEATWSDLNNSTTRGKNQLDATFQTINNNLKPWQRDFTGTLNKTLTDASKEMESYDVRTLTTWSNNLRTIRDNISKWGVEAGASFKQSFDRMVDAVKQWGIDMGTSLHKSLDTAVDNIRNFFNGLPGETSKSLDRLGQGFKDFFAKLPGTVSASLDKIFADMMKFFQELPGRLEKVATDSGKETMRKHVEGMHSQATSMDTIRRVGDGLIEMIGLVFATVWIYFLDAGVRFMRNMANGVLIGAGDVANAAGQVARMAKDAVFGWVGNFYNSGRSLFEAFGRGISDAAGGVISTAKSVLQKIRNMLPFSDAKEGPLAQLTLSGQRFSETFAKGIGQGAGSITKAANDALNIGSGGLNATVTANAAAGGQAVGTGLQSVAPAPVANTTLNLEVNIGMYAGMPTEKRAIAEELWKELVRSARAQGVQLPQIGSVGVQ